VIDNYESEIQVSIECQNFSDFGKEKEDDSSDWNNQNSSLVSYVGMLLQQK